MSRRPRKKLDGLTYEEFRKEVKQGRVEPLYLFTGEEQYLHDRALRLLFNSIDEAGRIFNTSIFTIGEGSAEAKTTAARALDAANQMPMMAARRIVVVREYDKIKEGEIARVFDYLKAPAPMTSVVFQSIGLDQRRKITTALLKVCTVVAFERLSEQQAARWAEDYLKLRGCRIEPGALGHLIGRVGVTLQRLANELEKLATHAGGGFINSSAVDALVPRAREHSNFELWDAIIERDRKRALRLTERLLDDGAEPVMLVGALALLYRRMLLGKELIQRQAPSQEVMKATGQYGPNANRFNTRLRRTPSEEIIHGLRRIAEVDNAIKNSEATPRLQIEYLVAELTLPESARWGIFHSPAAL